MSRKWTTYHGGPNQGERIRIRVTLNSRGVILLNKAAYECMGSPGAVELLFDEDEGVIGLKPKDLRHQNAFPLKVQRDEHEEIPVPDNQRLAVLQTLRYQTKKHHSLHTA